MDLNKVLLIGNLTRDPELRYLSSGSPVCEFGMAINRKFRRNDGEQGEDTCFVEIVVWARQAETCNQYLKKGSGVFVEGRLQFEQWETQEGQKRNKLKVVGERVQFMPRSAGRGDGGGGGEVSNYGQSHGGSDRGFQSNRGFQSEPSHSSEPQQEFDPDVPF